MTVERIIWTDHAEQRLAERGLSRPEVEQAVRDEHDAREHNPGAADWRVYGTRSDGRRFAVVYDHPVRGDSSTAQIVSVWTLRVAGHRRRGA